MDTAIGIGIIGCGNRVRHLAQLLRRHSDGVRIAALCDPSPGSIERTGEAFAGDAPRVHAEVASLCGAAEVDWVMVGSWNVQHRAHAVAALRAGKHVFCEKPLATTLDDGLAIRDAVRASGRTFFFGLTLRFAGFYRKLRSLLDGGAVGTLMSMEFNETLDFNHGGFIHQDWRRHSRDAGPHVLEKCCHDVDIAQWLGGGLAARVASFGGTALFTPERRGVQHRIGVGRGGKPAFQAHPRAGTSPFTDDKDIVDHQVAILQLDNGVCATFHTHCAAGIPERRFYLLGTEGAIRADLMTGAVEHRRTGWDEPTTTWRETGGGHGDGDQTLVTELAACMTDGTAPAASLDEAITSLVTPLAIDEARVKGEMVDVRPYWNRVGITLPVDRRHASRGLAGTR